MLKVHGVHGSPFVRKVLITLELKGLDYEMVAQIPFTGDEEYRKLESSRKDPTLVDGDLTLGDSKVICRYLEAAYPEVPVFPTELQDKAMADWYDDFASGPVAELAAGIFFQRFMRPRPSNRSLTRHSLAISSRKSCRRCSATLKDSCQSKALSSAPLHSLI